MRGESLLKSKGCTACHSLDGSPRVGPSFLGMWGKARDVVRAGSPGTVVVDEAYLARSLRDPDAEIAAGFPRGNMPRFDLPDADVTAIASALAELKDPKPAPAAGSMTPLALSVLGFVGFHFILSSIPVRKRLGAVFGKGYPGVYSLVALAMFVGIVWFYRSAPYVEVWAPPRFTRWIPILVMPIAIFFLVAGNSTPSATSVGQGERAKQGPRGVQAITRHPALTGFALWALAHLAANGELHVIIVAAGILVLAIGGMFHIDHRRKVDLGEAWSTLAAQTSRFPFVAMAQGRAKLNLAEIGWKRLAISLVVFVLLLFAHPHLIGASPFP